MRTCVNCGGLGEVPMVTGPTWRYSVRFGVWEPDRDCFECPECGGSGEVPDDDDEGGVDTRAYTRSGGGQEVRP